MSICAGKSSIASAARSKVIRISISNTGSGNEKGYVESSVKELRKKIFSKKYVFDDFESAEAYMHEQLIKLNTGISRIEEEQKCLLPYKPPLELGKLTNQKVNKYSFIQVENNYYSVPDHLVDEWVKARIYQREILVYSKSRLVARHKKIDGFHQMQIDIYHYLDTLARKPGALKNSKALKSKAELKTIYDTYFTKRTKEFIEVLRKNTEKSYEELLEILRKLGSTHVSVPVHSNTIDDSVTTSTRDQLQVLSDMFRKGGAGYVS